MSLYLTRTAGSDPGFSIQAAASSGHVRCRPRAGAVRARVGIVRPGGGPAAAPDLLDSSVALIALDSAVPRAQRALIQAAPNFKREREGGMGGERERKREKVSLSNISVSHSA